MEPDRAGEAIVGKRPVGEHLGQTSGGRSQEQVQLEQPLAGGDEPLREPQVIERGCGQVRDAPRVAEDLDGLGQAGYGELAVLRQHR